LTKSSVLFKYKPKKEQLLVFFAFEGINP